jgi:hypothetical protein
VFSRVFTAAKIDGADDKGPGDTTTADVQKIFVAFLHMSLKSAFLIDECFLLAKKQKNFRSWDYSPKVPDYQDFQIMGCQIKRILLFTPI